MFPRPQRRFQSTVETCEARRLLSSGMSRMIVAAPAAEQVRNPAHRHHPSAPILQPEKPIKDDLPDGSITIASFPTLDQPWTPVVTYKSKYAGTKSGSVMFLFNYRDPPGAPAATSAGGQLSVVVEGIEHGHVVLQVTGPTHTYTTPGTYTFGVAARERDPREPGNADRVYAPSHPFTFTLSAPPSTPAPGPSGSSDQPFNGAFSGNYRDLTSSYFNSTSDMSGTDDDSGNISLSIGTLSDVQYIAGSFYEAHVSSATFTITDFAGQTYSAQVQGDEFGEEYYVGVTGDTGFPEFTLASTGDGPDMVSLHGYLQGYQVIITDLEIQLDQANTTYHGYTGPISIALTS